jgi:dicarboxylate transporter DctA-like protein
LHFNGTEAIIEIVRYSKFLQSTVAYRYMNMPKKILLRLLRYLGLFLVLFTLVLLLQTLILPGVVRRIVEKRFAQIGLHHVNLEIRSVTWRGAELANIRLDEQDQARIGALAVRYTPASLLRGNLNMVEITGLEMNIKIQDGTIDLGFLQNIQWAEKETDEEIPFEQIDIRSSALCVEWEEKQLCFPVAGHIRNVGEGSTEIDLEIGIQGTAMNLQGKVCLGEESWQMATVIENLDVRTLLAYLPREMVSFPLRAGGNVTLNLQSEISGPDSRSVITLDLDRLWLKTHLGDVPLVTEGINGKIHLQLDNFKNVAKLNGTVTAEEMEINSIPARRLQLGIAKQEYKLLITGNAEGKEWSLPQFTASISEAFPLHPKRDQSVAFSWNMQGRLPSELLAYLRARGMEITQAGTMQVSGMLKMNPSGLLAGQIPTMKSCALRMKTEPIHLEFENGMQWEQVSGTVQIIGTTDPNGMLWQILPSSKIALDAFRDPQHDLYVTKASTEKQLVELTLPKNPVDIWIPRAEDRANWQVNLPPLALRLNRSQVQWNEDTRCDALEGRLQLKGHYSPDGFTFRLLPDGWIRFQSLENTNPKREPWKVGLQDKVYIKQGSIGFDQKQKRTHWILQADIPQELRWDRPGFRVKTNGLRLTAEQTYSAEGRSTRADLSLKSWQNHFLSSGYVLESYQTQVDAHAQAGPEEPLKLNAEIQSSDLVLRDETSEILCHLSEKELAPISLFADWDTRNAELSLDWPLQETAHVRGYAELDFKQRPRGQISVRCEGLQIDDDETLFKNIIESTGWQLRGIVSLDANIQIEQNRIRPQVTVTAKEADIYSPIYDVQFKGIEGAVTFTRGAPLTTPGGQQFRIREAQIGKIRLNDGLIVFRLEKDPPAVFIENTDWHWAGGRLYKHALRIDPAQNEIPIRFFAEGLQVSEVFDFVLGEDVTGEGTLYGMLPVVIFRKNLSDIQLGPGYLHAAPEGGWWKVRGAAEQVLQRMIHGSGDADSFWTSGQISVENRIFLGLTHFEFDTLKIDLLPDDSALTVQLTTTGRSADRINAVEYKQVMIEIPRFDQNLQKILWMRSEYQNLNKRLQNLPQGK